MNYPRLLTATVLLACAPLQVQSAVAPPVSMLLPEGKSLPSGQTLELPFSLDPFLGRQVRLRLKARIEWNSLGGNTQALTVSVNGQPVQGRRLINKPLRFTMRDGTALEWGELERGTYRLMYSPDFSNRIKEEESYIYGLPEEDQDPYLFLWDLTPYVEPGQNHLKLATIAGMGFAVRVEEVAIEVGEPMTYHQEDKTARTVTPAPTGPLPHYAPKGAVVATGWSARASKGGDLEVQVGERAFRVATRTSLPDGEWSEDRGEATQALVFGKAFSTQWENDLYRIVRTITPHPHRLQVKETVTNLTQEEVGLMLEHRLQLPEVPKATYLAGRELKWMKKTSSAVHPTVLATYDDLAIGLAAEDDLLRLHAELFQSEKTIGLADRTLCLRPGAEMVQEWSFYVLPSGNYWDFVNAIRRDWGSNFTLEGPVTFTGPVQDWGNDWAQTLTPEKLLQWLEARGSRPTMMMTHVATNPNVDPKKGTPEHPYIFHGSAVPNAENWLSNTAKVVELMSEVAPEVKVFAYLHPNLSTEVEATQKYSDSIARTESGSVATSVYEAAPHLFIPMQGNRYGAKMESIYRHLIDDLGAHLYLDELTVGIPGRGLYEKWDGYTAVINPTTHAIVAKPSESVLLMQPWMDQMIQYAKAKGRTAFINTAPPTRTMLRWRLQHITEDTGPGGITTMHLSTPLAWTYDNGLERGWRHVIDSLEYGALSFSRSGPWQRLLFPFTPVELHAGLLIGEERIVTSRSGRFGWNDGSTAEAHVFDGSGAPVATPDVKTVSEGGKRWTEVWMPSDHLAILIRRAEGSAAQP